MVAAVSVSASEQTVAGQQGLGPQAAHTVLTAGQQHVTHRASGNTEANQSQEKSSDTHARPDVSASSTQHAFFIIQYIHREQASLCALIESKHIDRLQKVLE